LTRQTNKAIIIVKRMHRRNPIPAPTAIPMIATSPNRGELLPPTFASEVVPKDVVAEGSSVVAAGAAVVTAGAAVVAAGEAVVALATLVVTLATPVVAPATPVVKDPLVTLPLVTLPLVTLPLVNIPVVTQALFPLQIEQLSNRFLLQQVAFMDLSLT